MKKIIFSLLLVTVLVFNVLPGYATTNSTTPTIPLGSITTGTVFNNSPDIISIELSSSCIALVKMNQTNDCPSYKQIFHYDMSNPNISGKFVTDHGFFHRPSTPTQFSYMMYPPGKTLVMVDPDIYTIIHSKEIIIVQHGFVYTNINDVVTNGTRYEYHDRYVDSCNTAKIDNLNYTFNGIKYNLINDTISYLESGCTTTTFNEKVKVQGHDTPADITKTQSWKNQKWYAQARLMTKNCITDPKCKPLKDPNSRF